MTSRITNNWTKSDSGNSCTIVISTILLFTMSKWYRTSSGGNKTKRSMQFIDGTTPTTGRFTTKQKTTMHGKDDKRAQALREVHFKMSGVIRFYNCLAPPVVIDDNSSHCRKIPQ